MGCGSRRRSRNSLPDRPGLARAGYDFVGGDLHSDRSAIPAEIATENAARGMEDGFHLLHHQPSVCAGLRHHRAGAGDDFVRRSWPPGVSRQSAGLAIYRATITGALLHGPGAILGASTLSRKRTTMDVSFDSSFDGGDGLAGRIPHAFYRYVHYARGFVFARVFTGHHACGVRRVYRRDFVSRGIHSRERELEIRLSQARDFNAAISSLAPHV